MDIGHVGSGRQAALEGLRAAQTRLSNVLLQSHQRLQNLSRQSRPPISTFQAKFGLRLGQTLHHETFLVYMAFQAWKPRDCYGNETNLVLRKARRANAIWLERVWTSWRLQGQLQKKDQRDMQRLEAVANMEERRQAASEALHQQLTIAETFLSQRQKRTQKEKLQRRSFAAWSRHSQGTFAARSQRAMKLQEVVNEPHDSGVQNEQEGRELELQRWADLLRRRSQDLRDATTLEFASGDFTGCPGRAVLRLCWCQWQSWRREHHTRVTDRQEQALLGGHFLPKNKGRQCLGRAWRAWQRLCSGAERLRPVWLQEQHHRLLTKVMGRLTKYQPMPSHWLLRRVMAAWFIFGRLRPARQRLHHLATAARHSDAQAVMAATAALAPGVTNLPSTAVASTPEVHWTPLTHRTRSQRLPLRLLSSRDFWTQKSWIRAWRFLVAKEQAFNAMLELTLEDEDTFLVSPKRVAFRH